ncbi:ABC transporter ATP-binding protein [Paenibacillus mucilaginosus]|uniref:ABC transporter related protein n=1 Tax=Paenibacillus mucilaginosus (strain KNP414) TaxID=1036673 RepID=F8FQX4_PAEMK|nr:ABC transporter ATP-binding protein [Paenibacillus mucilaginosus]AEI39304.1 ABC transporter related protein [Paenibacillus mucilaginosus KNP414]MCG7216988.1 ABC transporter ATP-binding protein [Paenibacillus mucilaginosus]WDM28303.1 ABC transporter ATP-binding protein [Paenibacillus mucilaginosus]
MTEAVIRALGLMKRYGNFTAVRGVSFDVYRGEVFGLLGPNGAGKTTTMEMIEGLRRPDEGHALVAGYDTRTQQDKVKEAIGVQLQSTSLFDLLTVREMVRMYASFYPKSVPVDPLLEDMILTEKAEDRVKHLSGGQKQRLAIALALVNDPQVVFLDEPTTGLDPQARRTLWDIVLRLKERGKTVVLSTHYMDEAHVLCDRICLMDSGQVIALDTPRSLVRSLQSESAVEFRLAGAEGAEAEEQERRRRRLQAVAEVKQVQQRGEVFVLYTDALQPTLVDLIAAAEAEAWSVLDLQTRTATLEDVFIHMTGRSLREA